MPLTSATISPFADAIAARQYYKTDPNTGASEGYDGMLRRVARHVARAEAIDAYKQDHGQYPSWYMEYQSRNEALLDTARLDEFISTEGYTSRVNYWEEEFFGILRNQLFSPGGRILAGAETRYGQLLNCFVLASDGFYVPGARDNPDSMEGIYELNYKLAKVTKTGGGCGISLSHLRESGSRVKGSGGKSSGPVSFLRLAYNTTLRVIKLEGVRRGAGMATLSINHPDILDFITAKDHDREELEGKIEAFNISVLVTDEFMRKVQNDELHQVISVITKLPIEPTPIHGKYHLPGETPTSVTGNPQDPATSKEIPISTLSDGTPGIPARWLWAELVEHAWRTGDPGILFIDRINKFWPLLESLGPLQATNPCGEEPLWPGESCCLGSIILDRFVDSEGEVSWQLLDKTITTAIRFLDNVLTMNAHPLPDTMLWSDRLRRVGLGVMGDAVAMFKLGHGYDSAEAMWIRKQLAEFMTSVSVRASEDLAIEKGAFPLSVELPKDIKPRRNIHTLSIAPTGTISMINDTTSGIEPFFALAMQRRVGMEYRFRLDPTFETYLQENRPDINLYDETKFVPIELATSYDGKGRDVRQVVNVPEIIRDIMNNHGGIGGLPGFSEKEQKLFATAHEVSPEMHTRVQAAWQANMDSLAMAMASTSKTVNMSNTATAEDVKTVYELGFSLGLKGITIYRDGSKASQVLRTDLGTKESTEPNWDEVCKSCGRASATLEVTADVKVPDVVILPRPRRTEGEMTKAEFRDANGKERKVYVYLGWDDIGYPLEVFVTDEDGGYDVHPYAAALGKMISMALKYGAPPEKLARKLRNIQGGSISYSGGIYLSVPSMIGKLLQERVEYLAVELLGEGSEEDTEVSDTPLQTTCNGQCNMIDQGGCQVCSICGFSKCG